MASQYLEDIKKKLVLFHERNSRLDGQPVDQFNELFIILTHVIKYLEHKEEQESYNESMDNRHLF